MWKWLLQRYVFSKRAGSLVKVISRLSLIGIFVGVLSFVVVMSVMNGFNDSIRTRYLAAEPHLVVKASLEKIKNFPLQEYKSHANIESIDRFESQDVILRTEFGIFGRAVAKGLPRDSLSARVREMRQIFYSSHGQKLSAEEREQRVGEEVDRLVTRLEKDHVLVGQDLARSLEVVNGDRLTVVPPETLLLPPEMAPPTGEVKVGDHLISEVSDIDSNFIFYISGEALLPLGNTLSRTIGYELRLKNPQNYQQLQDEIAAKGYHVESWRDRNAALFFALKVEKTTMGTFLLISALITCSSILIFMVLLMTQKQNEIGMMMAMGMSKRETQKTFSKIGFGLASIGTGMGILCGLIISLLLEYNTWEVLPEIYYDATIPARVDGWMIVMLASLLCVFCWLMAYWPARAFSGLEPADAIRKRNQ